MVSPQLTGGDSGAALTGLIYGGAVPVLLEASLARSPGSKVPLWTALLGSTAGVIAGPVINRTAGFSRGRWNLISLGGAVGALMGGGVGYLGDAWSGQDKRPGYALTTLGTLAGLGLTAWLTSSFGVDEPRGTALLHFEGGKLSGGSALSAIAPVLHEGRMAAMVRAVEGSF